MWSCWAPDAPIAIDPVVVYVQRVERPMLTLHVHCDSGLF